MTEDRSLFLGSSDIAAILGLSPWATAYDVWLEKTERIVDAEWDTDHAKRLRRGNRMEPLIIEMLQEERDVFVLARNVRAYCPEMPFLACQLDYVYDIVSSVLNGNGEVKSVDPRAAHEWGPDGSQEVPAHYAAQIMYGLAVTGRQEATITALIGDDLRCYRFERDEELCAALIQKAIDFWNNHVIPRIPPPPQTRADAAALVRKFAGFSFEASDSLKTALAVLRDVKVKVKSLAHEAEAAEVAVLELLAISISAHGEIGDAAKFTVIEGGKSIATWNLQKRDGYVVKPTEFRVLRLGKEK